jgi:hypothetical protein
MYASVDRSAEFTYNATKDEVDAIWVDSYSETQSDNSQASSDGLVYAVDVGISLDSYIAENVGLVTRLYRLSELDTGVERAAAALQKRARQAMFSVNLTGRLDPRLEVGDILLVNKTLTSTNRVIADRVIVEDISITIVDGQYRQSIQGRRDVDGV